MKSKSLIPAFILLFLFSFAPFLNAQQSSIEKKENKTMTSQQEIEKYMNKIAADSSMRMQMMSKIMNNIKGDTASMMQMFKKVMNNSQMQGMMKNHPQMQSMMMNMMHDGEGMMKRDMNTEKSDSLIEKFDQKSQQ